ncbi:MAG: hypothetical protein ABIU06_08180 [Anaerolineales bacterium]
MKTTIKIVGVLILLLATFGKGMTVSAGGGGTFRLKGQTANAHFSNVDQSGCIYTDVYIYASEEIVSTQPGPGSPSSGAYVSIYQFDACTGTQLLGAGGFVPLAESDFQVSKKLESAGLNTTVTVFDYLSGSSYNVSVALTWSAISPIGRQTSQYHYQFAGCHQKYHSNGTFRFAQVSGSVSDGVTDFAVSPFSDATISSVKTGSVSTGCV